MTLPTEKAAVPFDETKLALPGGIAAANAIVSRLLAAIAPGIVVIDHRNLVRHVDAAAREPGETLMTFDTTHFFAPVQVCRGEGMFERWCCL